MSSKHDIEDIDDIKLLVNTFYDKIRQDDLLAPIFNERINNNWAQHLEKMYRFWQTVLLAEHTYFGSPFPPHANLPVAMHAFSSGWLYSLKPWTNYLPVKRQRKPCGVNKMAEMFEKN